jgi:hypothetical protein
VHVLDAYISITRGSGRGLGPGILEFFRSVADPGCLSRILIFTYSGSRILIFTHSGSRISDPGSKNSNKREK